MTTDSNEPVPQPAIGSPALMTALGSGRAPAHPVRILIVEDNPADVRLVREVLRDSRIPNTIECVADGVEALAYLERSGKYSASPRPHLIIMDLNMPKVDGRQVLRRIKADVNLRRIPVVVMTSSQLEDDIVQAYDQHANCYIRKPMDFQRFREVVTALENFWFSTVELPP
jgi:two-component system, chemotaxis family, response regulator Rcp1